MGCIIIVRIPIGFASLLFMTQESLLPAKVLSPQMNRFW